MTPNVLSEKFNQMFVAMKQGSHLQIKPDFIAYKSLWLFDISEKRISFVSLIVYQKSRKVRSAGAATTYCGFGLMTWMGGTTDLQGCSNVLDL